MSILRCTIINKYLLWGFFRWGLGSGTNDDFSGHIETFNRHRVCF